MGKLAKVLGVIGAVIAALGAVALAFLRAFRSSPRTVEPPTDKSKDLDAKREEEVQRIKDEIKKESDEALAARFNTLAKKEKKP